MARLANWCFVHRRATVAFWIVAVVACSALGIGLGTQYKGDFELPPSESRNAQKLLKRDFPEQSGASNTIVFRALRGTLTDPDVKARLADAFVEGRNVPHVQFIASFYDEGNLDQLSTDGTIAYSPMQIEIPDSGTPIADVARMMDVFNNVEGDQLQIEFTGKAIQDTIEPVPGASEGIGVIAAGIVLFVAFGSLVTMSLPLITAVMALGVSIALIGLMTFGVSLATFAPSLAGLMALGVGIDYALLIVNRHQQYLLDGKTPAEALRDSINTAGYAVLFAGLVVFAALIGLVALGISFITGLALAAAVAVLLTMVASLTFLPAMLGFVGMKALTRKQRKLLSDGAWQQRDPKDSGWYRFAKRVQRHPRIWGSAALAVMLVLSVPFASLRLGASDEGNDPKSATTRKAYDMLTEGFGQGHNGPLMLVTSFSKPADFNTFTNMLDEIGPTPGISSLTAPFTSSHGTSAVAFVYPTTSPQSVETSNLIDRLRNDVLPPIEKRHGMELYVGGSTASFDDFGKVVTNKLPYFMAIVIGLSFLFLMVVFRSLVVPLKASLMNLLTTGVAFGVVTAVFQWGWGGELIGGGKGPIESFVPVILFAITFGLSMDYEVFLVKSIREEWLRTGDNGESIALGQARTGRLITAAALIMVLIFASFIIGPDRIIKIFGVGLATAIIVDALIVRAVLVPAFMHIFGKWNWWLPDWLDRRLPEIGR